MNVQKYGYYVNITPIFIIFAVLIKIHKTVATTTILYAALTIGLIGMIAAIILFFVSKVFHVEEDPRIDEVQA